jgi:bifunctional N-acetylglucosamine-1-phosphate-uridyltransferase/glucosamine-1-phosphate-acetyltransferase GlmU-like protein
VDRVLVIPAAGSGSRLGAQLPKLLVPVNGRPMIEHLLALHGGAVGAVVVVVSPQARAQAADALRTSPHPVSLVVQESPTGMLDAILLARPAVEAVSPRRVLVTWCDQIAIRPETAASVVEAARQTPEPALVMPTCRSEDPYVHLVRDDQGRIVRVLHRREGDEMPTTGESDAGLFDLSAHAYLDLLPQYAAAPEVGARTGERNFVPFVARVGAHHRVVTIPCREREEAIGINTPEELARIEAHLRLRQPA